MQTQVCLPLLSSKSRHLTEIAPGIGRLDYLVSAAEAKGVKLVFPLLNYWDDLGGINVYNNVYGSTKTTWYTNTNAQAACKPTIVMPNSKLSLVIGRLISDPL